jgi:predicted nuclease of predicted toxin-antitoxin system
MISYLAMGTLSSELGPIVTRLGDMPRVYADANVPQGLVAFMRHVLHWDVYFVLEHPDMRRARDDEHFRCAREMRRTLVTLDRDFTDDRRFPPEESGGVVVLTAPDERRFEHVLRRVDEHLLRAAAADGVVPGLPLAGRKVYAHTNWP